LIPLSCGENVSTPSDCGDPATISADPAKPILGGYPTLTNKSTITLFGTKSPNTSITINKAGVVGAVVDFDCLTTWAADVSLNDGPNDLEILSLNRTSVKSSSTPISITKQPLPLPPLVNKDPNKRLCDVNKDGFNDIVVGSYENDAGGQNAGRVFIYYGGSSGPDTTADVVLTGELPGDRFGISTACAGYVNNDDYADVIVGAFLNDAGGKDAGRAYIFFGSGQMDDVPDLILTGQAPEDQFGTSVSTAGDVNGDGYDDVIVGAYGNDGGGKNAGRAYIYYGGPSLDNLPDVVLTGQTVGDQLGIRVAWAGDVNRDNYDEVIVSADGADVGSLIDAGKAYIFFGSPFLAGQNVSQADVILQGSTEDEAFASVARAGDLDNDGFDDVVVGASAYTAGSGSENCRDFVDNDGDGLIDRRDPKCHLGRAYVFLGGPALIGTISASDASVIKLEKPTGADGFGFSVASAGDVNGDRFSDLLVGAFLSDRTVGATTVEDAGRAYLYFGGPFDTIPDVTILGEASFVSDTPLSGQFGFALSGAGNLDSGDLSDIVIGAYLQDIGIRGPETDVGRAYIFLGQSFSLTVQASDACVSATLGRCLTGSESVPFGPDNGFGVSVQ